MRPVECREKDLMQTRSLRKIRSKKFKRSLSTDSRKVASRTSASASSLPVYSPDMFESLGMSMGNIVIVQDNAAALPDSASASGSTKKSALKRTNSLPTFKKQSFSRWDNTPPPIVSHKRVIPRVPRRKDSGFESSRQIRRGSGSTIGSSGSFESWDQLHEKRRESPRIPVRQVEIDFGHIDMDAAFGEKDSKSEKAPRKPLRRPTEEVEHQQLDLALNDLRI